MTGVLWAPLVVVAGVVLLLLGVGWALGRAGQPWPGPESHRGPLLLLVVGAVAVVVGFVWAVIVA